MEKARRQNRSWRLIGDTVATFLELCRDVAIESGTVATGTGQTFASVSNASGRLLKIVRWTASAWEMIQSSRGDWRFMFGEYQHALTPGVARYLAASLGITDFGSWVEDRDDYLPHTVYDPAIGSADEHPIRHVSYEFWRTAYGRGAQTNNRPVHYAVGRDDALCLGQIPDKAYIIRGEYKKAPQVLTSDDDVPAIAAKFHQIIVWRAIMLMAEHDEGALQIATARQKYSELLHNLVNDQVGRLS